MAKEKKQQICIITVTGVDKVGIITRLAGAMAEANINILDVNQKIMEAYFVMAMAVDICESQISIEQIREKLDEIGTELNLSITLQDQNIFKVMHRI